MVVAPQQERANKNDVRWGNNVGVNLVKSEGFWDCEFTGACSDGKPAKWLWDSRESDDKYDHTQHTIVSNFKDAGGDY